MQGDKQLTEAEKHPDELEEGLKNAGMGDVVNDEDIKEVFGLFEQVPPFLLKVAVSGNMNVVRKFETQIKEYKDQLSEEDKLKLKKFAEMPLSEIQELLKRAYAKTEMKQFKILSDPKAESFLKLNLEEFKKVLFES